MTDDDAGIRDQLANALSASMSFPHDSLEAAPPPSVPDHVLIRKIGRGSYGEVWLARNIMNVWRAVKIVYRRAFDSDRPYQREFDGIRRFEPVSRSHPSQLNILHVGRNDVAGCFYYVMELADDAASVSKSALTPESQESFTSISNVRDPDTYVPRTLRANLNSRARLPFDECLTIGLALATALDHLHRHGLVHRDIKPSNIVFLNGIPKLADIGLVTHVEATLSFVGTEGYLPPEGPGTPQADIYSFGKVLYEMATGRDRQDYPELPTNLIEAPAEERVMLAELNEIIVKACHADAKKRYQTAAELHADLALLQSGKSIALLRKVERRLSVLKKFCRTAAAIVPVVGFGIFWQVRQNAKLKTLTKENLKLAQEAKASATESAESQEDQGSSLYEFATQWGEPGTKPGQILEPVHVQVWDSNRVLVIDHLNHRLQEFDPRGRWVGVVATNIPSSYGIARDTMGNIFVTSSGTHSILKFESNGRKLIEWGSQGRGPGQFESPHGIVADQEGNLFVADTGNHRIQEFTSEGRFVCQWSEYGGSGSSLRRPCGLALDAAGRLWVADFGNNRLQQFDREGRWLRSIGSLGSGPAEFHGPTAIALDHNGNLIVSDTLNHRIQKLSPRGSFICEWGRRGTLPGFFNEPDGVAIDAEGSVYVADLRNTRIQKFQPVASSQRDSVRQTTVSTLAAGEVRFPGAISGLVTNPINHRVYCLLEQSTPEHAKTAVEHLGVRLAILRNRQDAEWLWGKFANHDGAPRNLLIDLERKGPPSPATAPLEQRRAAFHWATGEPVIYSNWAEHEPNNYGNLDERFVCLLPPGSVQPGAWNDCGDTNVLYGAPVHGLVELGPIETGPPVLAGPITNPANGHWYYLLERSLAGHARISAERLGGHLVTINDAAEQRWVFETFGNWLSVPRHLWIGLEHPAPTTGSTNRAVRRGEFYWHTGEPMTYMNWAPNEPNVFESDTFEPWVHMWAPGVGQGLGLWNDVGRIDSLFSAPLHGVVEIEK